MDLEHNAEKLLNRILQRIMSIITSALNNILIHKLASHTRHAIIPYSAKLWQGKTLANLAKRMPFVNIFTQPNSMIAIVNSPTFSSPKL